MNFKLYDAEIEILSPTTVTSGFDIGGFEVVFENNKIHIIDIMKMLKENKKAMFFTSLIVNFKKERILAGIPKNPCPVLYYALLN